MMKKKESDLKKKLMGAAHEKVADILVSLYFKNRDIQKQLDITFAGLEKDPKKLISLIKKEISSLKRSTKFVGYYEAEELANHLDNIREFIKDNLGKISAQQAFEMMGLFLDLHENTLNRVDDSNGSIGESFSDACKDLGCLLEDSRHLTLDETVDLVFSLFMNNEYAVYDSVIKSFKGALGKDGLSLLQQKFETNTASIKCSNIKLALQNIADAKEDVDAYIRACSFDETMSARNHLEIAKRLITHWRAKEALEWLDKMDSLGSPHPWKYEIKDLKIQALELEGAYEPAQAERLSWFSETLSSKIYEKILSTCKPDFKENFKVQAIKTAQAFPNPHGTIDFLMDIQEYDELRQFVITKFKDLSGNHYYTLRPAAKVLQEIDPLAATLLYRKLIEPILEETKSKYYNYAAQDLAQCDVLSSKITDWKDFEDHKHYLSILLAKNKRKYSFWEKYEKALHKETLKEAKLKKQK